MKLESLRMLVRTRWTRLLLAACLACMVVFATPAPVHAASSDDEESEIVDARLEGYAKSVTLESSTALQWVLLLILGVVCIGPLFMNAKRTHLD